MEKKTKAYFHLPGLFEFFELYSLFLPLYNKHREYFYDWAEIGSIYGSPANCLWGGGRVGFGDNNVEKVLSLMKKNNISSRLTFSNCFIENEHLEDRKCNRLCSAFNNTTVKNGVIITSDLLLDYIKSMYPNLYFVSSTTKVITDFDEFKKECDRKNFKSVVPDFRLNKEFDKLNNLSSEEKNKVEFLVNECCNEYCLDRKACYENVSLKNLGKDVKDHVCKMAIGSKGYSFSKAMENKYFISLDDIINKYIPMGFTNFKIEGRSLGSAIVLEFLLYYLTKSEYQLKVREEIYLDSSLDLF